MVTENLCLVCDDCEGFLQPEGHFPYLPGVDDKSPENLDFTPVTPFKIKFSELCWHCWGTEFDSYYYDKNSGRHFYKKDHGDEKFILIETKHTIEEILTLLKTEEYFATVVGFIPPPDHCNDCDDWHKTRYKKELEINSIYFDM